MAKWEKKTKDVQPEGKNKMRPGSYMDNDKYVKQTFFGKSC